MVHVHSPAVVRQSLLPSKVLTRGQEMQKAFGVSTHDTELHWHLVDNSQDMHGLGQAVVTQLHPEDVAIVLRGHGAYVWGNRLSMR